MNIDWNDKEPIYRQLHDRLVELIMEGVFLPGEVLPSIREISSEHRINHITVARAIQMLVDENLVEKRRGLGMFVREGVVRTLVENEKVRFLKEEWPAVCRKIDRLGLDAQTLLKAAGKGEH